MSNPYLIFLWIQKSEGVFHLLEIDHSSRFLLDNIVLEHKFSKSLTVTEAMSLRSVGSPATVNRKLDELRKFNLISYEFRNNNRRTKFLIPTHTAIEYYKKLSVMFSDAHTYSKTW